MAFGFIALPGCTSDLADTFGGVSNEVDAGPGPKPNQDPRDIAELIYFSKGLSAQERSDVGAYIEARWGIDVAP